MKIKKIVLLSIAVAAALGVSAFLYTQGKPGNRGADPAGAGAMQLKFPVTREDLVNTINEAEAKQRYAAAESRRLQTELNEASGAAAGMQLDVKRSKLAQANYAAPEAGIFLFGDTKEPQLVKEGDRLDKIVDLTRLQLLTTVGEYDVFRILPGMPVDVKVEALQSLKLKGNIERVSKFAKPGTNCAGAGAAQFEVVISLEPNEKLIAGLSLTGTIETERKQGVLTVSTLAVQHDKDRYFVTVLGPSGAAEKRAITIGTETADKTEVVGGLNEGDTVVLE